MAKTLQKNIRIRSERWDRTETAATEPGVTANQLLAELAMEAVGRREWLHTVHEVSLLCYSARGFDADRRANTMKCLDSWGSNFRAEQHPLPPSM